MVLASKESVSNDFYTSSNCNLTDFKLQLSWKSLGKLDVIV